MLNSDSTIETSGSPLSFQNRQCQDLGVRGIGVGADSPLPPLHSVEAGLPLTTQPLHYAESIPDNADASQEFKSLPGKLGPVAAPILTTAVSWACSCLHSDPDSCEQLDK